MNPKPLLYLSAFILMFIAGCSKKGTGTATTTPPTKKPVDSVPTSSPQLTAAYNTYTISCVNGGNFIEVSGTNTQGTKLQDGTALDQAQASVNTTGATDRWQKWIISKQASGYFTIMNLNSGKYLDVPQGSTVAGTTLDQYRASGDNRQLWSITTAGTGNYKIINIANGLAITNHGASTTSGTPITQEAYTAATSQQWVLNAIAPDSYRDDAVVGFFQRTIGSDAFDGGASVPLTSGANNGSVLWVTNDTFYSQVNGSNEFSCGLFFTYHNSALIQPATHSWDPTQTNNITSPDGPQIFHDQNTNNLLWPGAGIEVGNHVYVHNIEVIAGTLTTINQYLGDITEGTGNTIALVPLITVPGMSGQTNITYSIGMVKPGDGYVYVYGSGGFLGSNIYVARFAEGSPASWTFWDGSTWAASPTTAQAAVVANGPVNNNTVGYANGKYVLIAMDFGFSCDETSRNMYSSVSTSPTGPFTNKQTVYTLPDYKQGHAPVFYNPTIHAEFNNGHNELLVDYCVNFYSKNDGTGANCLTPCSNPDGSEDPNDYRPKGVRIPFSLIGL